MKCESQGEVDYYWNKLTADGGAESQSLSDKDAAKANRVMRAMLKMQKIDIAALDKAAAAAA